MAPEKRGVLGRLWESSKLAAKFFSRPSPAKAPVTGLLNVSAVSRAVAVGGAGALVPTPVAAPPPSKPLSALPPSAAAKPPRSSSTPFDVECAVECGRLLALILFGAHQAKAMAAASAFAHADRAPLLSKAQVVDVIAFSPSLDAVKRLWYFIAETTDLDEFVRVDAFPSKCHPAGVALCTCLCVPVCLYVGMCACAARVGVCVCARCMCMVMCESVCVYLRVRVQACSRPSPSSAPCSNTCCECWMSLSFIRTSVQWRGVR